MRVVFTVAYDGTDFCGWQVQTNKRTVQGVLERAIYEATGENVRVTGSGRTDSGVHAAGQVCHFNTSTLIPPEKLYLCVNQYLPSDVSVLSSREADDNFDCSRAAKRKTYRYRIYISPAKNPLLERYCVKAEAEPDILLMRAAAEYFVGEHDFKAFCASGSSAKTTVRKIYSVGISEENIFGARVIFFDVCGGGFLYNMVRSMVGELMEVGLLRLPPEAVKKSLEEPNRSAIGRTMRAKGLTLISVEY